MFFKVLNCTKTLLAVCILTNTAHAAALTRRVMFEENRGQAPREAAFFVRDNGSRIWLTRDGSVIAGSSGKSASVHLLGAKPAEPAGRQALAAKSNYLIGADPSKWRRSVPNYAEVRYAHAYPGIDVVWHARGGEIEQDFVVAPGADPRRIRFGVRGAMLEGQDLVAGPLRFRAPHAYQDGREIACRFRMRGQAVSFALGKYDRARPLTIDPVLIFSTLLGGSGVDAAQSVAVDKAGNIYVAGTTSSADFPISAAAFQSTYTGGQCGEFGDTYPCPDLFVSKFSSDGSTLLFSTFLGGTFGNTLAGMAIDPSGNVYLTGIPATNFPKLTPLSGFASFLNGYFVAKLSSDGSSLLYSTMVPVLESNALTGIAVDSAGAVYVTGADVGDLPATNAFQSTVSQPPLFKTTDSAAHWQGLASGLPFGSSDSIAVDPSNPQTIYFATDEGLYKSIDGGAHWTTLLQAGSAPPPNPDPGLRTEWIAIDPSHSQTVYLGTFGGIYKSTDGGTTWSAAGRGANPSTRMIAIDPTNTSTLYDATDAGLYKSTDGAATWNATSLMAGSGVMFFMRSIVIDPSTPTTLYAGTANGVMKSLDAGVTWTAMNNGFSATPNIQSLVIDPVNPQALYAVTLGYNEAPYWTADGGAHWTQGQWSPAGDLIPYANTLLLDASSHTTVWAVTDEGLLVSHDSGATWAEPPINLPYYNVQQLASGSDGAIYAIANNVSTDAFVLKLDPTGSKLVYCTYLGGSGPDWGQSIAVDGSGRAYITGWTSSFDFPTANALQSHPGGMFDAFVSVLDPTGSQLLWSTYLGGAADDRGVGIAVDPAGSVHLAGWTSSPNFPLQQASQTRPAGSFAAKLKGDGSSLIFSTYFGGSQYDAAWSVAADAAGNTYAGGNTESKDMPTLNAIQSSLAGAQNGFVASWNGQTGALQYATYLGGGADVVNSIAADAAGNAYVTGYTGSPDFPRKYAYQYTFARQDAFLAKIAPGAVGPAISLAGATNAASYTSTVSPGEIVSIFGKDMAVTPAASGAPPLPLQLSDLKVTVNGVAAPLYYVSPLQINAQIPFETALGTADVQVNSSAGSAHLNVPVAAAAPAIFTVNSLGTGAGAIEHGVSLQLVTDSNPATAGEIVAVYCTGLGAVSPPAATGNAPSLPPPQTVLPVTASVGGAPATVTYAGLAPGFAGLYQVNLQIPAGTPAGAQTLAISTGGAMSNTVTIAIY